METYRAISLWYQSIEKKEIMTYEKIETHGGIVAELEVKGNEARIKAFSMWDGTLLWECKDGALYAEDLVDELLYKFTDSIAYRATKTHES